MMKIKQLYYFLMLITSFGAQANIIELSCSYPSNGMTEYVVIDTALKTVLSNKLKGTNVSISDNLITYDLIFKKAESEFTVEINRTTGKMVIINLLKKTIDSTYECEPVKRKF